MTKYSTHALQNSCPTITKYSRVVVVVVVVVVKNIHHEVLTIYFALEAFRRWLLLVSSCPTQYKSRNDREPLRQERAEVGLL